MTAERYAPLIYVTVSDGAGNKRRVTEQTSRVTQLEYTDSQNKIDKCTLTVGNFDLANFDDPLWSHGNLVAVSWGYPGNMAIGRELIITKVTGFEELKVEAKAKSLLIDAVKKSRTFENMTRSEIVRQIAGEYGYLPETLIIEETETRLGHVTQAGVSDAQFVRKLAHQQGFDWYVDHEGFHFHEAQHGQPPCRIFTWYTDRGRGDVLKIAVESDITRKPAEVKKKGRDPIEKTNTETEASNATDTKREGTAGKLVIVPAADLMTAAFEMQEKLSAVVPPPSDPMRFTPYQSPVTAPDAMIRHPLLYTPADQGPMCLVAAGAEATKKFRGAVRSTVKMKLDAVGDPSMLAKTVIQLAGVGKKLSGLYFVKEVKHTVGSNGYTMSLTLSSDGVGEIRSLANDGLPVVGNASKAKRTDVKLEAENVASIILRRSVTPDALVAAPLFDKNGVVVGTAWRERKPGEAEPTPPRPPRVVLRDDAFQIEEDTSGPARPKSP